MRLYLETNFMLELLLEQEQHAACEELLQLAAAEPSVTLAMPAFCLAEPYGTLARRQNEHVGTWEKLSRQLREFKRSRSFTPQEEEAWSLVSKRLVSSSAESLKKMGSASLRLLEAAHILPLTADVIAEGVRCREAYKLSPPDALVFASVLSDPALGNEPSCFLNRNSRDFMRVELTTLLEQRGCKLISRFDQGLSYVQSVLRGTNRSESSSSRGE